MCGAVVLKLGHAYASEFPEGIVKTEVARLNPLVSVSVNGLKNVHF